MKISKAIEIKVGDTLTINTATGMKEMVVDEVKNGMIIIGEMSETVERMQEMIDDGFVTIEAVIETANTERQVTFLGITTTINPLKDRAELQKRAEQGLITPIAYYYAIRATWNNLTAAEKQIEFAELNA